MNNEETTQATTSRDNQPERADKSDKRLYKCNTCQKGFTQLNNQQIIVEFTLEKDHMNVMFAKRAFLIQVTLILIKEFILEKDLFSVIIAKSDLLNCLPLRDINEFFTIAKSLKKVLLFVLFIYNMVNFNSLIMIINKI